MRRLIMTTGQVDKYSCGCSGLQTSAARSSRRGAVSEACTRVGSLGTARRRRYYSEEFETRAAEAFNDACPQGYTVSIQLQPRDPKKVEFACEFRSLEWTSSCNELSQKREDLNACFECSGEGPDFYSIHAPPRYCVPFGSQQQHGWIARFSTIRRSRRASRN